MNARRRSLLSGKAAVWILGLAFLAVARRADAGIAISNTGSLSFGDLTSGASAGTVVISAAGARSTTGGVTGLASAFGAASFAVTRVGGGSKFYNIILPGSVTLTSGGGFTMTVDTFTSNPSGTGKADETLTVGATLNVGASQKPGSYTGTFSVTVVQQ